MLLVYIYWHAHYCGYYFTCTIVFINQIGNDELVIRNYIQNVQKHFPLISF